MDQDRKQVENILDALETVDDRIEALATQVEELRTESAAYYEGLRKLFLTIAEAAGQKIPPNALDAPGPESDELYAVAEASVIAMGKASTSFLQRKLGVG